MKNLFKMFAVAVAALVAVQCTNDATDDIALSVGDVEVAFTAEVPASRLISDGTTATKLYVQAYAVQGSDLVKADGKEATLEALKATVNLKFVQGMSYKVIFWAQADGAYSPVFDANGASVAMNYAAADANDEARDAFYAVEDITVNGPANHPVELFRPLSQLNIATDDLAVAESLGFELAGVKVEASAYETLNLVTGEAEGALVPVVFEDTTIATAEKLNGYDWLSFNYLLVGKEEHTLDEVKVTISQTYGNAREISEAAVPVKRNYRTNLVGSLLTTHNGFNVELVPGIENINTTLVNSASTLQAAINAAGSEPVTIALTDDLDLAASTTGNAINITGTTTFAMSRAEVSKHIILDLNGKTINATIPDVTQNTGVFYIAKGQKLTITGEGTINCVFGKATGVAALFNNVGGELVIENGTYTLDAPMSWQDCLAPLFIDNNSNIGASTVTINGGSFTWTRNLFRNFSQQNADAPAKIVINGGVFSAKSDDVGLIWNQKTNSTRPAGAGVVEVHGGVFNYVQICSGWNADDSIVCDTPDYTLTEAGYDGEWYYSFEMVPNSVSTLEDLKAAVAEKLLVKLEADIELDEAITVEEGKTLVLDLNGQTLSAGFSNQKHTLINKGSLTINGGTIESTGENGGAAIYNAGELTITDATIVGAPYVSGTGWWPSYAVQNYGTSLVVENCNISGEHGVVAAGTPGTVVLNNCTAERLSGASLSSHLIYISHADAHVIVNGGTYTYNNGYDGSLAYVVKGTLTVNDGNFIIDTKNAYGPAVLAGAKAYFKGGYFKCGFLNWGGEFVMTGGTYTQEPKYVAEGYVATKNTDGTWTVAAE